MLTEDVTTVAALERSFQPSAPNSGGFEVLDAGEVSVVITHADLPGRVMKRVSGFHTPEQGAAYANLIEDYCAALTARDVPCVPTAATCVPGATGTWTVHVVQPMLPATELGKTWLTAADENDIGSFVRQVAEMCRRALSQQEGRACGIDAQIANWQIRDGEIVGLVDVTTPLFAVDGRLQMDVEVVLRSFPALVRPYIRWTRSVEKIFSTHLVVRTNVRDLIANLHKEGRRELVPAAVTALNGWLVENDLGYEQVTEDEVASYYQANAASLELSSKVRRLDARLHRLLRRPYHATVPPAVQRHLP